MHSLHKQCCQGHQTCIHHLENIWSKMIVSWRAITAAEATQAVHVITLRCFSVPRVYILRIPLSNHLLRGNVKWKKGFVAVEELQSLVITRALSSRVDLRLVNQLSTSSQLKNLHDHALDYWLYAVIAQNDVTKNFSTSAYIPCPVLYEVSLLKQWCMCAITLCYCPCIIPSQAWTERKSMLGRAVRESMLPKQLRPQMIVW